MIVERKDFIDREVTSVDGQAGLEAHALGEDGDAEALGAKGLDERSGIDVKRQLADAEFLEVIVERKDFIDREVTSVDGQAGLEAHALGEEQVIRVRARAQARRQGAGGGMRERQGQGCPSRIGSRRDTHRT